MTVAAPSDRPAIPDLRVPPIRSLDDFRDWLRSDAFPETGEIDFIDGVLEIDMSPQATHYHGRPSYAIAETLSRIVRRGDLGILVGDCSRISLPVADTSREPDVVFVSHAALDSGRVVEVPKRAARRSDNPDSWEFVGPPDLIVEVVSDSSATKDKKRLRKAYEKAGVTEYWIVDARGAEVEFDLLRLTNGRYRASRAKAGGWRRSGVFGIDFRLTVTAGHRGRPIWHLETRGEEHEGD